MESFRIAVLLLVFSYAEGEHSIKKRDACSEWTVFPQKNFLGGQGYPQATELLPCLTACKESSSLCYAIDFNPEATTHCWLHFNSAVQNSNLYVNEDNTHYRRDLSCGNKCSYWNVTSDIGFPGGTEYADADTAGKCKEACEVYPELCYAVDFNTQAATKCTLHLNASVLTGTGTTNQSSTHYQRDSRRCRQDCEHWQVNLNRNYNGGVGKEADNFQDCQIACILDSTTCYAVDYNPNASPKCWLHYSASVLTALLNYNSDTTLYKRDLSCNNECYSFEPIEKRHYLGGTGVGSANTVDECENACYTNDIPCYAFDFNPNSQTKCYLHFNYLVLGATLLTNDDTTHYRITSNFCPQEVACVTNWGNKIQRRHGVGASLDSAQDVTSCKQACVENTPKCYSIDFNRYPYTTNRCWLHTTDNVSLNYNYYIDHYRRTNTSCKVTWCDILPAPENGSVSEVAYSATYSCNSGYQLSGGSTTRTCQEDRQWSGTAPLCEASG